MMMKGTLIIAQIDHKFNHKIIHKLFPLNEHALSIISTKQCPNIGEFA